MPTEYDARRLLARAADTIDAPPEGPLPLPATRKRRWLVPAAAAAAVALIAGGGVLLGLDRGTNTAPAQKPMPVEREHVYPQDQVPAVLGYTDDEARKVLEGRGLVVELREEGACLTEGFSLGTDPAPGTPFERGDRVTLAVSGFNPYDCDVTGYQRLWRVIRFARGLGGAPPTAAELRLVGPDGEKSTISRELARDRFNWNVCAGTDCRPMHSITGAIARWVTAPVAGGQPVGFGNCARPATPTQPRLMTIEPLDPDLPRGACPGMFVELDYDAQGRLTTVRLASEQPAAVDPTEPSMLQLPLARHFVKWARGEARPPAFAHEVLQLHFDRFRDHVPRVQAETRDAWTQNVCSGLPPSVCGFNPLEVIKDDPRGVEVRRSAGGRSADCRDRQDGELPRYLAERTQDIVEIRPKAPTGCDDTWSIELWVNPDGEIDAVNLRLQQTELS